MAALSRCIKKYRTLFHQGRYIRLDNQNNNRIAYGVVEEDRSTGVFFIHQLEIDGHSTDRTVLFAGLHEDLNYTLEILYPTEAEALNRISESLVACDNCSFSGRYLMEWGIPVYLPHPGTGVVVKISILAAPF